MGRKPTGRAPATCHPERVIAGDGLCKVCYEAIHVNHPGEDFVECSTCHKVKPRSSFYSRGKAGGIRSQCISCVQAANKVWRDAHPFQVTLWRHKNPTLATLRIRNFHLKKKYNLTQEDYQRMYDAQQGCCAICGDFKDLLVVDHDHATGAVRDLLCKRCNTSLGWYEVGQAQKEAFEQYLTKHQPQ